MRIYNIFFICILITIGCTSKPKTTKIYQGKAMTIPYMVIVENTNSLPALETTIDDLFLTVNLTYNKFNPNSELSALNNAKTRFQCSDELYAMLKSCEPFVAISAGKFDPTIGALSAFWEKSIKHGTIPSVRELEFLSPCIGWEKLSFEPSNFVFKKHPDIHIDLGGIAKGRAVDMLFEKIQHLGYKHIFVEWGGEIRVTGGHPEGRPWNVGIKNPKKNYPMSQILHITEGAVATSGDYEQFWICDYNGSPTHFFHIYDKETLSPLQAHPHSIASTTVQHESCMVADAIASILLMLDSKQTALDYFQEIIAKEYPTATCFLISHDECT